MPILVRVKDLEEGMCLARNVVNNYSVLLPHGHVLTEKDLISLGRIMPDQMIHIIDPLLDQMVDFQDDSRDQEISREVRSNVAGVIDKVSSNVRSGVSLEAENVLGMQKVIQEMLKYLQENPVTMAIIEQSTGWDFYLQEHSANVFYLSLVIGNTIRNYVKKERERLSAAPFIRDAMKLTPLATASLFHDIGMVPLEKLYHKKGPLTDKEKILIRAHPQTGADMLPDGLHPMVRKVVYSHHENQNGTGYPEGITGDKITIFARILRVADAYAAAVADKPYCKGKPTATVLYEMLHGRFRPFYDPVILKVFSSMVPPFPIGAKLKLQSESGIMWAVVVRQNTKDIFSPEIMVAYDEFGDPLPKEDLQPPFTLGSRKDLRLVSFSGEDISFLNRFIFETDHPQEAEVQEEGEEKEAVLQSYGDLFDFEYP